MAVSKRLGLLVTVVYAALFASGACGGAAPETETAKRDSTDYASRISTLEQDPLWDRIAGIGQQVDRGKSTECLDPAFDNRVPTVWRDYRRTQPAAALEPLSAQAAEAGWAPQSTRPFGESVVQNFTKSFGDWSSVMIVTVDDDVLRVELQADASSACA